MSNLNREVWVWDVRSDDDVDVIESRRGRRFANLEGHGKTSVEKRAKYTRMDSNH